MTAIGLTATVSARCSCCPIRVALTPSQAMSGGAVYCSTTCRVRAQVERKAARNGRVCAACGRPGFVRQYGLEICLGCRTVAWRTCWRKRAFTGDQGSVMAEDGIALCSYRCPLCPFWHLTKEGTCPPADFLAAQVPLARLFAEVGFSVDRYRNRSRPAATALGGMDASLTAEISSNTRPRRQDLLIRPVETGHSNP